MSSNGAMAAICASHTSLMRHSIAASHTKREVREAFSGANELLTWVAGFAVQSVAGDPHRILEFYEPIDGRIVGVAMLSAVQRAS